MLSRSHALARLAAAPLLGTLAFSPANGQQLEEITVGGPPSESLKALYYAQHAGLFQKAGVSVTITPINSGSAAMAAVAGGAFDLAHANLLSAFEARDRGVHFVVVAPSGLYETDRPQAILIVKKDSPIRTGADLNGKIIGASSLQDLNAVATLGWIDQHGGDSRTVRVVELTNSSVIPAIADGRIAAATVTAPFTDLALQSGVARQLGKSMDAIATEFEISGYIGTAEVVDRKKAAMRRFAVTMHEASVYTNAHGAEMVDLIASYTGITPDVLRKTARTVDPEYVETKYIQPFIEFAARYKIIPRPFPATEVISDVALAPPRSR